MKKKMIALNAALVLGVSSIFTAPAAYAESLSDLHEKKKSIQDERSDIKVDIKDTEAEIDKLEAQQLTVEEQLEDLVKNLEETASKIEQKNNQIAETKAEIEALKAEIIVLKDRIAKRNEVLKDRAVSFQESGGDVNYLEVIFGSSSFSDFLDRVNAVATIAEADRDILIQHEQDKKELETKQKAVEDKLASLESMKAELVKLEEKQKKQKQQKEALQKKLKHKHEEAEEYKVGLEEEAANLAAQESAIKKAIELEKSRLAEAESARKRAAEEAKQQASSSSAASSSPSSSSSSAAVKEAPVSSGSFTRPSAGVVTSQMGPRWNKQHAGIDIAASGNVSIVAAADGVVSRSYYSDSYGNVIFISHSIGGQLYTTVYAHLNSRQASAGQVVSKGQQIGIMGNTGHSYGQHLHFEVHKGPWNVSKSNAVNPLNYVSY
ncbi:murein hydrolase activator EnvC family protein [Peribacillus asahii]|uniref:Peptidase M23 n=1 Tax=Peribacillus asahii TaxID=228899 RepID=A0A3Q9RR31_9BACI|nr:M23 family metallopeptidase [Peribacillus asahii]AZV45243.1 peptidase M23 [Peribacillus asahii]USK84844.1 peptidoglycan DD-metalloendopeptidase family protein [Peribacillus asahii]